MDYNFITLYSNFKIKIKIFNPVSDRKKVKKVVQKKTTRTLNTTIQH